MADPEDEAKKSLTKFVECTPARGISEADEADEADATSAPGSESDAPSLHRSPLLTRRQEMILQTTAELARCAAPPGGNGSSGMDARSGRVQDCNPPKA